MGVNGIGAGYSITGYGTRKNKVETGENFAKQAAEAKQASGQDTATLHGADEESGDIAVSSWADVVSGASISVYNIMGQLSRQKIKSFIMN